MRALHGLVSICDMHFAGIEQKIILHHCHLLNVITKGLPVTASTHLLVLYITALHQSVTCWHRVLYKYTLPYVGVIIHTHTHTHTDTHVSSTLTNAYSGILRVHVYKPCIWIGLWCLVYFTVVGVIYHNTSSMLLYNIPGC